jgi:hypothetical protein
MRTLSASLLLLLTACATSNEITPPLLPIAPPALVACAAEPVPAIPGTPGTGLTKSLVAEALADQRAVALLKNRCARGWKGFYDDLKSSLTRR